VESKEEEGSAFHLYFQAGTRKNGVPKPAADERPVPNPERKETVLVVEDEDSVRRLVKLTLIGQGYRVLEASGERDALRIHEKYRGAVHVLLTDVVLPGKSGREIAKAIEALRPGIRIVFMSGYAEDPLFQQSIEKTGADFLAKPFTPSQLLTKVRHALEKTGSGSGSAPAHS